MNKFLKIAALLGGVMAAAPALAQEAVGVNGADIIVTAQRRAERAQDVPVVVTAFTPERLQQLNIKDVQGLYGSVPSLVVGQQGNNTREASSFTIRGQATGFLSSPAVVMYLNEVPLPAAVTVSMQGAPGLFFDLENVQVLSGPQGTLFGRNTTGGAVLFQPRKPVDRLEGYLEGSIGNYDLRGLEGAINIPIVSDKLMVRVSGTFQDRDGFTKDLLWNKSRDDIHYYSGRVGVVFKPTEAIENYLFLYGAKSSNNGPGHIHKAFNIPAIQASGLSGFLCGEPTCAAYAQQDAIANSIGPRQTRSGLDGFSKVENWGAINTTTIDLSDELTLRNIVSFQRLRNNYAVDQDGTPLQQYDVPQGADLLPGYANGLPSDYGPRDNIRQFTEELQLQGSFFDRRLTFTTGGFYFDASPEGKWNGSTIVFCPSYASGSSLFCTPSRTQSSVKSRSHAIYAQATMDLGLISPALDNLRLTGGVRQTWDSINGTLMNFRPNFSTGTASCNTVGQPQTGVPLADLIERCQVTRGLKTNALTWMVGLDYKPVDNLLLYAKASRGYKAGGFNTAAVRLETLLFRPEELTTYEAGFKSDWKLGAIPLRLNATYFYSDYTNIHRPSGDFNSATRQTGAVVNGATATIQGLELETSIRPVDGLEIGGTLSHTDADYKKFSFTAAAPTRGCNGLVPAGGTVDKSCLPFQFVTPWLYNVHVAVDVPISERLGKLSLFAQLSHFSAQPTNFADEIAEPGNTLEAYSLVNASASWSNIAQSGVDVTLFANNILNKTYRVSNSNVYTNALLTWTTLYGEPRMYGLRLRYKFGA